MSIARPSQLLRLAPFAIWVGHASASYATIAIYKHLVEVHRQGFGATAARLVLFALTLIAFLAALAVIGVSRRAERNARSTDDRNGRRAFTAGLTALAAYAAIVYLLWALVLDTVLEL
jgi:hypothetical protein